MGWPLPPSVVHRHRAWVLLRHRYRCQSVYRHTLKPSSCCSTSLSTAPSSGYIRWFLPRFHRQACLVSAAIAKCNSLSQTLSLSMTGRLWLPLINSLPLLPWPPVHLLFFLSMCGRHLHHPPLALLSKDHDGQTELRHVVFGVTASTKLCEQRKNYI